MTSAAPLSTLTSLQQNDSVTLAILTAVGYDYVLTFSKEIEHIWTKQWTKVSTLFILIRYFGLGSLILPNLLGSTFLPGPAKVLTPRGNKLIVLLNYSPVAVRRAISIIAGWLFMVFHGAAELVMILRVWVIYNRSRLILGTLLVSFASGMISTFLAATTSSNPRNLSVLTFQIVGLSFCTVDTVTPIWTRVAAIVQITHGAMMCALAVFQFVRVSLRMHRATKQWQINRYMTLLVRQGILYFVAMFVFSLANVLDATRNFPAGGRSAILLYILKYVPMYTLTPRLVMDIREMYAMSMQRGQGMDTGFGLSYHSGAVGSRMYFAEADQNLEELEEVDGSG